MSYDCNLVAVVDDDHDLRASLVQALQLDGLRVVDFPDGNAAARRITRDFPGMVITDLRMPGLDGTALFARLHDLDPDLARVSELVADGDLGVAAEARPHTLQRVEIARFERGLVASKQLRDTGFRIRRRRRSFGQRTWRQRRRCCRGGRRRSHQHVV